MIRRTIKEHLDKELRLAPLGIKVLSLFFIDRVDRYRKYDEAGNPRKGEYALIFEEEYRRLAGHPDYQSLFKEVDVQTDASLVHDGYFSQDKKGVLDGHGGEHPGQPRQRRARLPSDHAGQGETSRLRDQAEIHFLPLCLCEGWDNPNVFQICA